MKLGFLRMALPDEAIKYLNLIEGITQGNCDVNAAKEVFSEVGISADKQNLIVAMIERKAPFEEVMNMVIEHWPDNGKISKHKLKAMIPLMMDEFSAPPDNTKQIGANWWT